MELAWPAPFLIFQSNTKTGLLFGGQAKVKERSIDMNEEMGL